MRGCVGVCKRCERGMQAHAGVCKGCVGACKGVRGCARGVQGACKEDYTRKGRS